MTSRSMKSDVAFHVVDYQGVRVGDQGRAVFTHRQYAPCVRWLEENQTEQDMDEDRYCLDGDEDSWNRKFR